MRIGIVGAGNMGQVLARGLAKLSHDVSIANSRGPQSLRVLAADIGATPVSVVEAAEGGEVVFLAIPTKAVTDLPHGLFANAPSRVVIDLGNYHPELRDGRIDAIDRGLPESRWVAQQIGRPVIKAFNNILAESLRDKGVPRGTKGRIALSAFGDSSEAKSVVLRLINDLGFDSVDAGRLDESWRQQAGTPAYCRDLEAVALSRALAEAERNRIAEYRAERETRLRRGIATQTPTGDAVEQNYRATLSVSNTPEEVFAAINNVRGWWSETIEGRTDRLGEFKHRYKDMHRCTIRIAELVPGKRVVWHVVDNYFSFAEDKTEWTGTDIVFEIVRIGDKTELRFTHIGLVPAYECYDVCSDAWGGYINSSLRNLITKGKGQPG